jgi:ketosteroid isomerase-like protein
MSEESTTPGPVGLVRRVVEAANARELDALMRLYAPNAVLDVTRTIGIAPQGWAAIRGHAEDWMGAFEELELVLEEPLDLGHGVVFTVVYQRGRPSVGTTGYVEQREGCVWVEENGLLVEQTIYPEVDEGRAAAERLAEERAQAMSENVDLVRSIYTAWERGDFSSAEWAHPEIEFVVPDGPDPGTWRGLAEMRESWRSQVSAWDEARAEAEEFRELDDRRVLVLSHFSGRGKTSGLEVGQKGAELFHVRDGKVTRLVTYWGRARALADLGLAE